MFVSCIFIYQKMTHCHLYKYEFVQDHLKVFQKLSLLLTYLFKCLNESLPNLCSVSSPF